MEGACNELDFLADIPNATTEELEACLKEVDGSQLMQKPVADAFAYWANAFQPTLQKQEQNLRRNAQDIAQALEQSRAKTK